MAMNLRLPAELDSRLDELAARRHTSKHAIIIEAAARFADSELKTDRVLRIADGVAERYADALKRLEDA